MTEVSALCSGYSARWAIRDEMRTSTHSTPNGTPSTVMIQKGLQCRSVSVCHHIGRPASPDVEEVSAPVRAYLYSPVVHEVWERDSRFEGVSRAFLDIACGHVQFCAGPIRAGSRHICCLCCARLVRKVS